MIVATNSKQRSPTSYLLLSSIFVKKEKKHSSSRGTIFDMVDFECPDKVMQIHLEIIVT